MNNSWKTDFIKAFLIFAVVAVIAIIVNWLRTPILFAMADQEKISRAKAHRMEGLNLIDDWTHRGWPGVTLEYTPPEPQNGTQDPQDGIPNLEMSEIMRVEIEDVKQFFDEGEFIFLDAREPQYYEEGHIPGAINWPFNAFDEYLQKYMDEIPTDTPVVCYCVDVTCDESFVLAESLKYQYCQEIYLFEGGMEDWEAWGYPVTAGADP